MKGIHTLKAPCSNCPFRNDLPGGPFPLHRERVHELAESLREGSTFYCHKTVDYDDDATMDDEGWGEGHIGNRARACAGSEIIMERSGLSGQMARISERLGLRDPEQYDIAGAPVYANLTEWVKALAPVPTVTTPEGEVLEYEHCGVVTGECEDPAGFAAGGGAYENTDEPTCNPLTDTCSACGSPMCASCRSEEDSELCKVCNEEEDYE